VSREKTRKAIEKLRYSAVLTTSPDNDDCELIELKLVSAQIQNLEVLCAATSGHAFIREPR
jgi:hypothetical protein